MRVGLVTKVGRPEVDVCVPFVAEARGAHLPQLLQLPKLLLQLLLRGLNGVVAQEEVAEEGASEVGQPAAATDVGFLKGRREGGRRSQFGVSCPLVKSVVGSGFVID